MHLYKLKLLEIILFVVLAIQLNFVFWKVFVIFSYCNIRFHGMPPGLLIKLTFGIL